MSALEKRVEQIQDTVNYMRGVLDVALPELKNAINGAITKHELDCSRRKKTSGKTIAKLTAAISALAAAIYGIASLIR